MNNTITFKPLFNFGDEVIEKTDINKTPRQILGFVLRGGSSNLSYIVTSSNDGESLRYEFELYKNIIKEKKEVGFNKKPKK